MLRAPWTQMMAGGISFTTPTDGVALITIDNPPLNLVTSSLTKHLGATLSRVAADVDTRVVVVTGAGDRAFCAGSDISEFASVRDDVINKKVRLENEVWRAFEKLPQPTVAAIGAPAIGGGLELALCCDVRFMDVDAWLALPELKVAVYPGSGATYRLISCVGITRAFEFIYSGRRVTAAEALQWGLATRVTPHGQALPEALAFAQELASLPKVAVQAAKKAVYLGLGQTWEETVSHLLRLSDRVFRSDDAAESAAAFLAKRPPHVTHS